MNEPIDRELLGNEIAICGMAVRVPGATSTREFWRNLRDGVESIRRLDDEELLAAGERPELIADPSYVKATADLPKMEYFDGELFGFSPKECAILDPQHRQFLECAWEALEDASRPPESIEGPVGVFAGCGMGSYFYFNLCSHPELVDDVGMFLLRHTGNDKDFLATRLSYLLDLKGPSVGIQTACSTSLVAVHQACQSLLAQECDMALAGGVTIELPHRRGYLYRENEILSNDGHCHAFDHRAAGTVFGSGAGVVVLRRLEDALADGDCIRAIVRATAVNNDGADKAGYLAPSVGGQAAAVVEAHTLADVEARSIGYVECHGTGTYLGDPIEIEALTQAFRHSTDDAGYCRIGSVKTNIGHLDTAAGVVSLVKAVLALENEAIPPSLGFEKPNPTIPFSGSPFEVNAELTPWPRGERARFAGVNSLGVGGTNAHAIVEEAPERPARPAAAQGPHLLQLSAKSRGALAEAGPRLAARLEEDPSLELRDVAYTLRVGRRAFDRRKVLAVRDREDAIATLRSEDPRRSFTHQTVAERPSAVFLFPGGGAQSFAMAKGLYDREAVFRKWIDKGLAVLEGEVDFDPRPLLLGGDGAPEDPEAFLEQPSVQLPLLLIVEYALAELWKAWGVEPVALLGHSMGENAAAAVAGVLSFEDAIRLVHLRGVLFDRVRGGGMLSVPLSASEVEPLLLEDLDLGVINGSELTVVSGPREALDRFAAELASKEIETQRIKIDIAAHSRLLDPILDEFRAFLRSIPLAAPRIPIVSNVSGEVLSDEEARDPDYWVRHLRSTVRFADGLETASARSDRVLIECGPGKTLSSLAKMHEGIGPNRVLHSLRHADDELPNELAFLNALGRAWAVGLPVPLERLDASRSPRRVSLPTYAFQGKPYFVEPAEGAGAETAASSPLTRLPDVTAFGHRPVWKLSAPEVFADRELENRPSTYLVFLDETGVGTRLCERLREAGHRAITVRASDAFGRSGQEGYLVPPELGRDGYDRLIADLAEREIGIDHVLHLWLLTADEHHRPGSNFFHRNLEQGFYSLFFLAQAITSEGAAGFSEWTVVANGMLRVRDEPLPYPEKAMALGPARVLPHEIPGLRFRAIDVRLPELDRPWARLLRTPPMKRAIPWATSEDALEGIVSTLEVELSSRSESDVVAYRGGRRWRREILPAPLERNAGREGLRIREGGVYLITGGLGGIGLTIARHLADRYRAKLILVGRRTLPPRDRWEGEIARRPASDPARATLETLLELEATGGEVLALSADVSNAEEMRKVIEGGKERFGALHGVVHAAGLIRDSLVPAKTSAEIEDVFTPKVHGTVVLDELLEDEGIDFFVLFSSTSAITGPAGQVDYVAANAFLDAYAEHHDRGARGMRVVAMQWGIWNEVGMAHEALEGSGATGAQPAGTTHRPLFAGWERSKSGERWLAARFSPERHFLLDDHRMVDGTAVIPGTGYVELAAEALDEYGEGGPFELEDLVFLRPLVVPDGEDRPARIRLRPKGARLSFEVRSLVESEGRRGYAVNAQGFARRIRGSTPEPLDVAALEARCPHARRAAGEEPLRAAQEAHLRFGERFRVLREERYGDGEAMARVELPSELARDVGDYLVHPGLLDIATGFAMELIEGYRPEDALWVPVTYERIRVHAPLTASVVSWVRPSARASHGKEFFSFDVTIADSTGRVLLEAEGFTIKRLAANTTLSTPELSKSTELEAENDGTKGERGMSPAERRLRQSLELGIRPEEGAEAFERVLTGTRRPRTIVSSIPVERLIADAALAVPQEESEATRFARPDLDSEYVAPRDAVEKTLVAFWEELLGVEQVGVEDSFFDLGGHSLIAVRLFAKVKRTFDVDFPISILFEAPTIQRCAALIREARGEGEAGAVEVERGEGAPGHEYLVTMHEGHDPSATPFFIVAGMFGNVLNLRHLAHLIGSERPCYGLQARGLYGGKEPHRTFEEMARDYLEEIRSVQPVGPYFIGGFSGGGLAAYEMAQQLRAAGEEVAILVLLDTPLPTSPSLSLRDRAAIQLIHLKEQGPGYVSEWARRRLDWELGKIRSRFSDAPERAETEFHNEAIEAAFRAALPLYRVRPYPGEVVLYRPKLDRRYDLGDGRAINRDRQYVFDDNGWTPYVEQLSVVEVPGDHDSMVLEPNVRVLARSIRDALCEAEDRDIEAESSEAAE